MTTRYVDVDTSETPGDLHTTRHGAEQGAESNKGIFDWNSGTTTAGDTAAEDARLLGTVFPKLTGNPLGQEGGGRILGMPGILTGGREVPLPIVHVLLGLAEPSQYAQSSINSPHLDPKLRAQLIKLYPHLPDNPEAWPLPGNKPTEYLRKGAFKKATLQQKFAELKQGLISPEEFKQVSDWAFKDDSILDAYSYEKGLQRDHPTILPYSPEAAVGFQRPVSGITSRVLRGIAGRTASDLNQPQVYREPWEIFAGANNITRNLRDFVEAGQTSSKPNPVAKKQYENLKPLLPEHVVKYIESQKDRGDEWRAGQAMQSIQNLDTDQRAANMSGWDGITGMLLGGATALPGFLATGGVSSAVLGTKLVSGALARMAGTATGRAVLAGTAKLAPLGRYPKAAALGAKGMYEFTTATKLSTNLAHPETETGNPFAPEWEAEALGIGLGLGGAALGHGWQRFQGRATAAGDLVNEIREQYTPSDSTLPKDTAPGSVTDPSTSHLKYQQLIDLVIKPIKEKRPRNLEEATQMLDLEKYRPLASQMAANPAMTSHNTHRYITGIITELDKGLDPTYLEVLKTELPLFKGHEDFPALEAAILKAGTRTEPGVGVPDTVIKFIQAEKMNQVRALAGTLLAHDAPIQKALAVLDPEGQGRVMPLKATDEWLERPDGSKYVKKTKGLTVKQEAAVQASLAALKKTNPEVATALEEALTHHKHLSGDLSPPGKALDLQVLLKSEPETITQYNLPPGKIDLTRVHPEDLKRATEINEALETVNKQLPEYHGRTRFKSEVEFLRKANILDELNKPENAKRGAAFKNSDVREWHEQQMGEDFKPLEDIVWDEATKKFVNRKVVPETTTEPDTSIEGKIDDGC